MARKFVHASNNRIEIAGLSDYTTQISVSAWVQVASDPDAAQFFTIFSKAKDEFDRNVHIQYRLLFGIQNLEIVWTQPPSTFAEWIVDLGTGLTVGVWRHIVYTVDWTTNPDSVKLSTIGVDRPLIQINATNNATPTTGSPALNRIGGGFDDADFAFDGGIAELAVWPGIILTLRERLALSHYAPAVVHPAGLELYTPLVRDLFDYKSNLALTNQGTTVSDHPPVIYAG